jgi:AcrR family transcriptional regulator
MVSSPFADHIVVEDTRGALSLANLDPWARFGAGIQYASRSLPRQMKRLTMITSKKKTTQKTTQRATPASTPKQIEAGSPSLRARGKGDRRARLIRAARDLIAERDDGNFSMPELAARAGLSLATPYNLLGSKAAILREVYRAETEGFRRADKPMQHKAPAERVMATVAHTLRVFTHNPQFYRRLSRSLSALGPDEMRQLIVPLSEQMFLPLVEELIADGAIGADVSAALITAHLLRVFESTFQHWAVLGWDEHVFRDELRAGFALTFLGLFAGRNRDALLAELKALSLRSRSA